VTLLLCLPLRKKQKQCQRTNQWLHQNATSHVLTQFPDPDGSSARVAIDKSIANEDTLGNVDTTHPEKCHRSCELHGGNIVQEARKNFSMDRASGGKGRQDSSEL
jgi:hypothetical protein